jgi:uncharacterized protein YjiS (DUF1127 family)
MQLRNALLGDADRDQRQPRVSFEQPRFRPESPEFQDPATSAPAMRPGGWPEAGGRGEGPAGACETSVRDASHVAFAGAMSQLSRRIAGLVAELLATARRAYKRRQAIGELLALDDRMLRDIGVSRSEIEYTVRYGRYRS